VLSGGVLNFMGRITRAMGRWGFGKYCPSICL